MKLSFNALLVTLLLSVPSVSPSVSPSASPSESPSGKPSASPSDRLVEEEDCSDIKARKECKSLTNKKVCEWKEENPEGERCIPKCKKIKNKNKCDETVGCKYNKKNGKCKNVKGMKPENTYEFNQLITRVEVAKLKIPNPNKAYGDKEYNKVASMKASKCLDLRQLTPDYSKLPSNYTCLPAYCEAITTATKCQEAFYEGCSYCSGKCVAAAGMQEAVIKCVRKAYKHAKPNMVNGKLPGGEVSESKEKIIFNSMAGLADAKSVTGGDYAVMSFGIFQDTRLPGYRVPIHVHPLGGYTCVNKGKMEMSIEGFPNVKAPVGTCFNMQAFTKMTQDFDYADEGYTVTDYFHQNSCLPTWVVVEEKGYFVQDNEFGVSSTIKC